MSTSDNNPSVEDIIAAKLKAKAEEAAREAAEEARGGGGNSGVHIGGNLGSVGGSVAGRDMIGGNVTTTTTTTAGLTAEDVAKLFDSVYARINQKPAEQQTSIRGAVDIIKAEAQKEAVTGEKPNELMVEMSSQALATSAPDILTDMADVALATLANPAAGVVTIIRKIAEKVKASRGG